MGTAIAITGFGMVGRGSWRRLEVLVGASAAVGLLAFTHLLELDLPADVRLKREGVVGPSAGLVLSLGTNAAVTETDLTHGRRIGVIGNISTDGQVGPVGGVKYKLAAAAAAAGAELFLLPAENADDAIGAAPSLRVVP